jgi:hypothetical protein
VQHIISDWINSGLHVDNDSVNVVLVSNSMTSHFCDQALRTVPASNGPSGLLPDKPSSFRFIPITITKQFHGQMKTLCVSVFRRTVALVTSRSNHCKVPQYVSVRGSAADPTTA